MQQQPLNALLQDLEQELLRLGYTEGSMTFYRNRWRKLEEYADRRSQVYYTEQFGIDFVQEYFGIPQDDFSRTFTRSGILFRLICTTVSTGGNRPRRTLKLPPGSSGMTRRALIPIWLLT